jgi:hypothetical protein
MRLPQVHHRRSLHVFFTLVVFAVVLLVGAMPARGKTNAQTSSHGQGSLTASPSTLSFGNVQVGSSQTLSETLTNTGSANLTIYNDKAAGAGFSMSGISLPLTLTPGQSYTFSVTFGPSISGAVTGAASVGSKNWRNSLGVPLSGTGTATGQLTVSPTTLNFGNVTDGTTSKLSGTLTASGAAVTVSSASSSNAQFVLSGLSFPLTLSAGQSAGFTVAFTPQSSGSQTGTLTFATSSSGSTVESLTGTGVAAKHSVSLNWNASTSEVVGYNVYRGSVTGGPYSKINSAVDPATNYTDGSVLGGSTYYYVTTAVDSSGTESSYSNQVQATIPSP